MISKTPENSSPSTFINKAAGCQKTHWVLLTLYTASTCKVLDEFRAMDLGWKKSQSLQSCPPPQPSMCM